ncbi:MAG: type II secretion system F family protein [Verrucomicrobiales bacterium]|nr:type II secretion system F family protein [Verrucomicrobiales bacterium]
MGLIATPRDFARRAELYHQLAQLTSAGIGLIQALHRLERAPPTRAWRHPLRKVIEALESGETFSEALQAAGQWVPAFDIALLRAGEQSGRLDECFRLLYEYYLTRAQIARRVIAELAYPVFLLHFAVFVLGLPQLFKGQTIGGYLATTLGILTPIYMLTGLILYAGQAKHGETWRALIERAANLIPGVGTTRRQLALARLAAALEALINAGFPIYQAWLLAAAASGSPALKRAVSDWKPKLESGLTPAEILRSSRQFPDLFVNLYSSGEVSGKLDEALRQLHKIYQEEGTRKLHTLAQWAPRIIYIAIVMWVAYKILTFWLDYFGQMGGALGL